MSICQHPDPETGAGRFAGGWPEQETALKNAFDGGPVLYIRGTAPFRVVWDAYGASSLHGL